MSVTSPNNGYSIYGQSQEREVCFIRSTQQAVKLELVSLYRDSPGGGD